MVGAWSSTRQTTAFNESFRQFLDTIGRDVTPCTFARDAALWLDQNQARTLLDVGCGTGVDTVWFAQQGYTVYSLDFSTVALRLCQTHIGIHQVRSATHPVLADLEQPLPFIDGTFDGVFAHLSLHYFTAAATARIFADIHRVLKPRGLLFVKVKSIEDPLYGQGRPCDDDMYVYHHIRRFYRRDFLLRQLHGFTILQLRHTRAPADADPRDAPESAFIEAIARKRTRH